MIYPSNAAKAAAILVFTSGVQNYDQALELYERMANSDEPLDAIICSYPDVCRWGEVDHMTEESWWEEVEMLAHSITKAHEHFKGVI